MPFIDTTNPTQLYILIGAAVLAFITIILIIVLIVGKRKKTKLDTQDEFSENVINALGGIENIKEVKLSRRRLSATVHDLDLLIPRELRKLKLGAVITKNHVKMLVKDNPKETYKYIEKRRKEGK
ncbi:MAG TPA: hypothetical protein PLP51_04450 [Acholeplasmataceae bacterium]|nr:hypothetical protein [Acholeplasmataceae bacterium]HQC30972.1 hypothetical protein [Acholeplasmataceae bacterium]